MQFELEALSLADPVFFDTESRWGPSGGPAGAGDRSVFGPARCPVPDGWHRQEQDVWVHLMPDRHALPEQGWKVHASACPDNAERVLATVYEYCVDNRVPFKFLLSQQVLRAHSLKYAHRSSSGKLVTIYPSDLGQLRQVLEDLAPRLTGEPGPYILTDLRWGEGPLYLRYGSFVTRYCPDQNGELVPALATPDGSLVPDRRDPVFSVPDWVEIPDFLAPHLAARESGGDPLPYQPETALHFSNGGGVYLARRLADGRQVVLKEARPHAGLDSAGRDAIARLRAEHAALRRLAGIAGVPAVYEYRKVWEHEFLVQEYLPGDSLFGWLADHHPLLRADVSPAELRRFTERALEIADRVEGLVRQVHARGLAIGDLHPANILVDDGDRVGLIDFELATEATDRTGHDMGFPGFKRPGKAGAAADRYAVAALKLWLFLPILELTALVPAKLDTLLAVVADRFPLPPGYLEPVRRELAPDRAQRGGGPLGASADVDLGVAAPDWSAAGRSMAAAILRCATPEREDRLFPGDIAQFTSEGNGIGFGYGAAGVLWALRVAGAGSHPEHERWLVDAATRARLTRPGFYDGDYGIAYALWELGQREPAIAVLERAITGTDPLREPSLHSGLAGAGLCLQHFAEVTGETRYADAAHELAKRLAEMVTDPRPYGIDIVRGRDGQAVSQLGARAGLLRGWSGPALLLLRQYQRTGEQSWLDGAVAAVHRDLALCRPAPDGSLQVDAGFALLPYLDVGSAGIALVAAEILAHRPDPRLAEALPLLARACQPELVVEPQLFSGRAGLLATLARLSRSHPELAPAARGQLGRLHWHALGYRGRLAFPGSKLRRLSMDLATGNAGVLLAVTAAHDPSVEFLPFLRSPVTAPSPPTGPSDRDQPRR